MGATYRKRGKSSYLITVQFQRQRQTMTVHDEQTAKQIVAEIRKQEILGVNVLETLEKAKQPPPPKPAPVVHPPLREALPAWLDTIVAMGDDIRASTARLYKTRCARWLYPHQLPDGRVLGDLPWDQVTRDMLGAVLLATRTAGKSMSVREQIRNPLRRFYQWQIETKEFAGPNPAADLKWFIGKQPSKRARKDRVELFTPEETPQLFATAKAWCPRWYPFIATGILAGLRWGESAALQKADLDAKARRIHVRRTVSDRGRQIEPCKDHESRHVALTPVLAAILREHVEKMTLDGQVGEWTVAQRAWVFPTTYGNVVGYPFFLARIWKPLLAKAGLPYRRYHSTRHTFATGHLQSGRDPQWVQQQMGHASIAETYDTYGHLIPERHAQAPEQLDAFLGVRP